LPHTVFIHRDMCPSPKLILRWIVRYGKCRRT